MFAPRPAGAGIWGTLGSCRRITHGRSHTRQRPNQAPEVPKKLCEKCRSLIPEDQFNHGVAGQECVCRRCLVVMGYRVK